MHDWVYVHYKVICILVTLRLTIRYYIIIISIIIYNDLSIYLLGYEWSEVAEDNLLDSSLDPMVKRLGQDLYVSQTL